MLSEDPTTPSPVKPRTETVTSRSPALCDQCNESLILDDSVVEPYLTTSYKGELYIGGTDFFPPEQEHVHGAMFGGIDYARRDDLPDLPALSQAAKNGCEFCAAVKEGLLEKYQGASWWKSSSDPLLLRVQYVWDVWSKYTELNSIVVSVSHVETKGWVKPALRFFIWATKGEDVCNGWFRLQTWAEEDQPWSPNNISMTSRWIDECVNESGPCEEQPPWISNASNDSDASTRIEDTGRQFLPTRLLDLFPHLSFQSGNTIPEDITLFDTVSLRGQKTVAGSHNLKYAALSYCWGGVDPPAKTTNANFKGGHRHITFSSLPQCLQDAVTVSRSLDIRYLWIDALCIIQGDADDWAREAGTMYGIFRNAFLTIGAAASTSFDEGFLTRHLRRISLPFSSSCNKKVSGRITLSLIPKFPYRPLRTWSLGPLDEDLKASEWNRRGWVWQEQNLSKRLLIFGKEMLHYKCPHHTRSENGVIKRTYNSPREETRKDWAQRIESYSDMHLTYVCDKLPAISGLAYMMDQKSQLLGEGPAEYLAGIWISSQESDINKGWRHQLRWKLDYSQKASALEEMLKGLKSTALGGYSAPSWSWASRPKKVNWDTHGNDGTDMPQAFASRIEHHRMIHMGPDRLGRVKPGSYLKLSGLMRRTPLNMNAAETTRAKHTSGMEWQIASLHLKLRFSLDWKYSPMDQNDGALEGGIRLFGLERSILRNHYDSFRGLLLIQDTQYEHFYRVGVFRLVASTDRGGSGLDEQEGGFVDWQQTSVQIR